MNDLVRRPAIAMAGTPSRGRNPRRSDLAYDAVKRRLLDGRLRQGDNLPVERLADELGMSRQPVMEAMKRLAEHGYVEIVPQVGCRVAVIDRHECVDLFRYLAVSEGLLTELAAERRQDAPLAELQAILREIGALEAQEGAGPDVAVRYRMLSERFRAAIRDMAGAELIAQAVSSMRERSDFHMAILAPASSHREWLAPAKREHEEIFLRIERRQPKLARQAMADHILRGYARTVADAAR